MLADELLLALDNISLSTSAGITGRGFCSVRLLDRVSLTIHAGQLVLLRGGYENGSAALLGVIAGDERTARQLTGDRIAAPGLVVRNGSIPASVIPTLVHAWTTRQSAPLARPQRAVAESPPLSTPLYLLRESPKRQRDDLDVQHWLHWCAQLRQRNGTIVIAEKHNALREEEQFSLNVSLPAVTRVGEMYRASRRNQFTLEHARTQRVRETQADCRCRQPVVRLVRLGFGRVLHEQAHGVHLCRTCIARTVQVS